MLDVFYTVDVEVWCDGWSDLDARFPDAYARHILGQTAKGQYGLPLQIEVLRDHGLKGAFFVEPLFATRFGDAPLRDIVGMLMEAAQDVQLHLHTEWVDEALTPVLPGITAKRQYLRNFCQEEQRILIQEGLRLLGNAGATELTAFRAGNFGFNIDTMGALAANGVRFDSSYNACVMGLDSGLKPSQLLLQPVEQGGVIEYPVTVFRDGTGRLRPVQITACSWGEMEHLLWQALEAGLTSVVIVSHSFELLDGSRTRPDPIAVKRFRSLCAFLDRHRDSFRAQTFAQLEAPVIGQQPQPLKSPMRQAVWRLAEQAIRRFGI
jgi:hypothetical protein